MPGDFVLPRAGKRDMACVVNSIPWCANGAPSCPAFAHREPFLTTQPIDPIYPRGIAVPSQQNEQPAIAKSSAFVGEIAQPASQFGVRARPDR